jgi:post-segregation antitoxin (ccd killing protein)
MKTRLTIRIDRELLARARRYAKARGVSLSELVEARLQQITDAASRPTFAARWRGAFEAAEPMHYDASPDTDDARRE